MSKITQPLHKATNGNSFFNLNLVQQLTVLFL